jgi:hypothetical protein
MKCNTHGKQEMHVTFSSNSCTSVGQTDSKISSCLANFTHLYAADCNSNLEGAVYYSINLCIILNQLSFLLNHLKHEMK